MAEEKEEGAAKPAGKSDPIVDRSLAKEFFIASAVLTLTVVWSLADEFHFRRPYKGYQSEFQSLALEKAKADETAAAKLLDEEKQSPAYQQAKAAYDAALVAHKAAEGPRAELLKQRDELTAKLNIIRGRFQVARGDYQPLVYELDHARLEGHNRDAEELAKKIQGLEPEIKKIFEEMLRLSQENSGLQGKLDELDKPLQDAQRQLAEAVKAEKKLQDARTRLSRDGPLHQMEVGFLKPYQIYNPALGVVDRCTSCHVAVDKPGYTKSDWDALKGRVSDHAIAEAKQVFATHPHRFSSDAKGGIDLLAVHNTEKFGCTSCHLGNGPATTSAEKAHGYEGEAGKSWTHPMEFQLTPILPLGSLDAVARGEQHFGNMMEAACAKCHLDETSLRGAPQLSYGRQLVEDVGCFGCHKIKGFEAKEQELAGLEDRLAKELRPKQAKLEAAITGGDDVIARRNQLAETTHEIQVATRRVRELDMEVKFIGPDLNRKDLGALKNKIYAPWLPRWILNPQHFRPGTPMPNPLLAEQEVLETSAFIWQQASGTPTDSLEPGGDPKLEEEGRRLVETRGCLACHALEDQGKAMDVEALRPKKADGVGEKFALHDLETWWKDPKAARIEDGGRPELLRKGEHFGPSLARVGEKIRYEWLVEWVKNPKSLQPHTRMPNLRLDDQEARAIASFLTAQRKGPPGGEKYPNFARATLEDPKLAERGLRHVIRYGCYNCHAIDLKVPDATKPPSEWRVMANPGKIGAELSSHGSKPLAQFDFGFVKVPETRNVWLGTKILEPRIWDRGKYKGDPNDRLRMPRFGLNAKEAAAVNTVLVGLTDTHVSAEYIYKPGSRAAAIIEGERLVRKFNCRSCHVIDGEGLYARDALLKSIMSALKITKEEEDDEGKASVYLPPVLNGEGHRAQPEWLFKFLKNPHDVNKGTLRPWHVLRMPTFDMSDAEATALVEYFGALEREEFPYARSEAAADDPDLIGLGRTVFVDNQCFSCHNIGAFVPTGKKLIEQGPDLALAHERLRAGWMHRFIPDPQAFLPKTEKTAGTNMPAPRPFLPERPFAMHTPEKQREIRAVTAYIRALGSASFREREGWVKGGVGPQK